VTLHAGETLLASAGTPQQGEADRLRPGHGVVIAFRRDDQFEKAELFGGTRVPMAVNGMITRGLSEKARAALERASELGKALSDLDYQLRALTCLVVFSRMLADLSPALALSRQVHAIAQEIATPLALATADCLLASTLLWVGQYAEARTRAEAGSREDESEVRRAHRIRPKADARWREVGRQSEQYHNRTAQTRQFRSRGLRARNRGSMMLTS
jgi:Ni/Co efflux regulator RcnB